MTNYLLRLILVEVEVYGDSLFCDYYVALFEYERSRIWLHFELPVGSQTFLVRALLIDLVTLADSDKSALSIRI